MSRFLLIHGVYHGPECWDAVVEELRARGHECHAMALRGHGPQDRGTFDCTGVGFADYLEDVRAELAASDPATILVGHSLGGMLVRRLIQEVEVAGAVMLCMPTPSSLRRGAIGLLRRFPRPTLRFLTTLRSEALYHDPAIFPWLFWSCAREEVPNPVWLERVLSLHESRRLFRDLLWLRFARHRGSTPVLVVGGGRDFALTVASQANVAAFHGAPVHILDDAPHDAMLTHPREVADLLDRFSASSPGIRGSVPSASTP